ncbi:nuclear exosome regulator NRDE2 [Thrips palmi]|uniref:Nuclear exosome regulator NRDE2 n=1 Tax=Thrips palmi TaxID=161013 RepID=A0A6P9A783_THRPL|nr:nuclear exosome regulator NRDE2 [Thrips palmi]
MFAAYAEKDKEQSKSTDGAEKIVNKDIDWLSNSSFQVESGLISNVQGASGLSNQPEVPPFQTSEENDTEPSSRESDSEDEVRSHTPRTPPSDSPNESVKAPHTPSSDGELSPCTPPGSPSKSRSSSSSSSIEEVYRRRSKSRKRSRSCSRSRSPYKKRSSSRRRSHDRDYAKRRISRSRSRSRDRRRRHKSRSRSVSRDRRRRHKSRSRSRSIERSKSRREKYNKDSKSRRSSEKSRDTSNSKSKYSRLVDSSTEHHDIFYEDKARAFGNLNVITLSRPAVAWYHISKFGLGIPKRFSIPSKKHTLKHRYYNKILKELKADVLSSKASKDSKEERQIGQVQGNVNDVEEEISKITAKFNQDLSENPNNIDTWKNYVKFQDVVHQFERVYRRGGGATGARVTAERKLSILDKALKENPMCEELLKERCQLAESVLPSDKLTSQLKSWIGKDPCNIILWEALIMASQGSLSTCKVPAVKSLYQEALSNINSQKRGNGDSAKTIEGKIIELVLHLGLFLRQAGLLELMWSLISIYLEFNIAKLDPSKFHITNTVADNALTELEEAILGSQLPLPTLWLRVETLRAGTHWVPLPSDSDSEDPQRLVFPEDVNDLIHPINCPHLTFRLVTVTLSLLKVPILPWRECAATAAGLHPLPWLLDGPEPLYSALLPLGTLEFKETSSLLLDGAQLACGPQYLIARPGQDEYIDFLTQVFSNCSDCLPPHQRTFLQVWWLRFYRWLMQLERLGHCKLPRGRKKKMRATAKDLLRQNSNRSNLLLFKEFALLELENGGVKDARKVLQGSIAALPSNKPVPVSTDRAYICALYRTLVEVNLSFTHTQHQEDGHSLNESRSEDRTKSLCLLVSLGKGAPLKDEKPTSTDIATALSKFNHITRETLDRPSEEELDPFMAPDVCHVASTFLVEWTACHGWLLFLSHSIWKAAAMIENVLSELKVATPETSGGSTSFVHDNFVQLQREAILETYVSLLRHHCHESRGSYAVLRKTILRGLKEFPSNLTFLAALADLESCSSGTGLPLWRLSKMFYDLNSAPAYVLFVFVMKYRLKQQESAAHVAHGVLNQGGPELPDPNVKNRMSTLLKKLTKHPLMRRCPLLWRLRLQFAAAVHSSDAEYSSTFYLALEDCPWVKALFMDIVQVLPTQLEQVQDLLVEKELRLHVTPEELEILRVE